MELLPFILLFINIIIAYLSRNIKVPLIAFCFTLLIAFIFNTISFVGLIFTALFTFFIYNYYVRERQKNLTFFIVIVFSILLASHKLTGFNNFQVIEQIQLSSSSIAFDIWLNIDKVLIGLLILIFAKINFSSLKEYGSIIKEVLKNYLLFMFIALLLVNSFGTISFDFKIPSLDFFLIWTFKMIFFTVLAEELFFRYLLIRAFKTYFINYQYNTMIALVLSSFLFGLAHFGGGISFVVLATIAGFFYGRVYIKTNRVESAIILHFLVNLSHLIFFAYPISV